MAFRIQLPTISQVLSDLYPMKIYNKEDNKSLPCDIMEIMENQDYGIPSLPIDNGTFIGDNIYTEPLTLSVRVFVRTTKLDLFLKRIKSAQFSNQGFLINGLDGQIYDNMRIESLSTSQTKEVLGGYFYNIQFKEMIIIKGFNNSMPLDSVQKASYSSQQDLGESNSNEVQKSTLKDLVS